MNKTELELAIKELQRGLSLFASREYGERAEKALSETERVERKEDNSIEELDAGLADATLMICELMKGE